jgi:hypothetical protein
MTKNQIFATFEKVVDNFGNLTMTLHAIWSYITNGGVRAPPFVVGPYCV